MEALSILDKENGILVSYSLNMHYTGEKTVCHYGKRRFNKEGNTKFTFFHDAEKFATELTKYLGIDTKT
jgi:hypothetical protein